eukprot:Transcript_19570.p1 GENE.Transcript_19570~~Transcript_19570.p1  ORF type:complete len:545 (-),score=112.90 Transcript_19570:825-2459(-)
MDQQRPAESPLFNPGSKADRPTADENNVTATSGGGDHGETPMMEYAAEAGREAPVEAPAEVSKPAEPPAEAAAEGGAERRLLFGQYAEVARAPANEAEVTSENVLVTSPDAEKGGAEAQADAEAGAAGAETLVVKPVDQSGNISNSAASVRLYSGLPPHGLTDEQISELFDAVQQMKAKSSNQNFFKHGWQCMFTLRAPGATTRGDMCVIDPRDGQKIFSLIGMRRKLGLSEAMEPPRSYPKEKTVRADDDPDAPPAPSLLLEDRTRRNRTVVNYAEKAGDRARPAEHVAAVLTEAGEQGVDLATLAESVHKRMAVNEEGDDGHVPYGVVRQVLIGMLRSGRARRRLRVPPAIQPGDSESALRLLVLNTMQIEPDRAAPWSLEVLEDAAVSNARRTHVWKGVTPHHLPHVRGARLVGRHIEIWWDGDLCFYPATVRHRAEAEGQYGPDCGKGMFIVEYEGGLRAIEDLEGPYPTEPIQVGHGTAGARVSAVLLPQPHPVPLLLSRTPRSPRGSGGWSTPIRTRTRRRRTATTGWPQAMRTVRVA